VSRRDGQTVIEFTLAAGTLALAVIGAGWALRAQWNRARCAAITFERTHAQAHARAPAFGGRLVVLFQETPDAVEGDAACPPVRESALIPKLD